MKVIAATTLAQMALAITVDKSIVPALIADNTGCTDDNKGLPCFEDGNCEHCHQVCDFEKNTTLPGEGTCVDKPDQNKADDVEKCTPANIGLPCDVDGNCAHCNQVCDMTNKDATTGQGTCAYEWAVEATAAQKKSLEDAAAKQARDLEAAVEAANAKAATWKAPKVKEATAAQKKSLEDAAAKNARDLEAAMEAANAKAATWKAPKSNSPWR